VAWLRRRTEARWAQRESKTRDLIEPLITVLNPDSTVAEAYRTLRTNLLHAVVDSPPKVIVITSSGAREGKTSICANLAMALTQVGKSTLIVDCDLRQPDLHRYFGLRNGWGLVDVLVGEYSRQEVWKEPANLLKVIPVGSIPPNPVELLDSQRFAEFLADVRKEFDYVLLDTPPVRACSDPIILAMHGDGVLLVLDAQTTRKMSIRQSLRSLAAVDANVIGTVMNNVKGIKDEYYAYGYSSER
jgi:capsular exopolysaccharide synthesis family protein